MKDLFVTAIAILTGLLSGGCVPIPDYVMNKRVWFPEEVLSVSSPTSLRLDNGMTMSLYGIWVPQCLREEALLWMRKHVVGEVVQASKDGGGSSAGVCIVLVRNNELLNASLIRMGYSLYNGPPARSQDALGYRDREMRMAEDQARSERIGLWSRMTPKEIEDLRTSFSSH
jgi:hypothetical protein